MELSRATGAQRTNMKKTLVGQESVRRAAERVFRRHGALSVQMSHLLPKGKQHVYDRDHGALVQGGNFINIFYFVRFISIIRDILGVFVSKF